MRNSLCLLKILFFSSNQSPKTAFPPIYSNYRETENTKFSTDLLHRNDKMSGTKLKYMPNSHRSSSNNPLREKMPGNEINQPFDEFFYEKLKAPEGNPATKNKSLNNVSQDIPNDANQIQTLPKQPLSKNKVSMVASRTSKIKPAPSLKCNSIVGNSKLKSNLSNNSSKSSNGKLSASRKSWTVTSMNSESPLTKVQSVSSTKHKLPDTGKKTIPCNDSDDGDNADDDIDNSVEDDDDFVEGKYNF